MSILFAALLCLVCVGTGITADAPHEEVPVDTPAEVLRFRDQCASLASKAEKDKTAVIPGREGWFFSTKQMRHLGRGRFWGEAASDNAALQVIVDFHRQLDAIGIELVLIPVPSRAVVYADKMPGEARQVPTTRLDHPQEEFYRLLSEKGVTVMDLTPAFLAARSDETKRGLVCCRTDSHWSPRGISIACKHLAAHFTGRPWLNGSQPEAYSVGIRSQDILGDLLRLHDPQTTVREALNVPSIRRGKQMPESDTTSPLLLLTDSHGLVFSTGADMHAQGGGFAEQLAAGLGRSVDLIAQRGSAATPVRVALARKFLSDTVYRKSKRAIIWCLASHEFSESQWKRLPMKR